MRRVCMSIESLKLVIRTCMTCHATSFWMAHYLIDATHSVTLRIWILDILDFGALRSLTLSVCCVFSYTSRMDSY